MDFYGYDHEAEVYSDEEGLTKTISGHCTGEGRGAMRTEKRTFED